MKNFIHGIEKALFNKGIVSEAVRQVMVLQIMVCAACLVAGLAALYWTAWPLSFGVGCALITLNFYFMSRLVTQLVGLEYSGKLLFSLLISLFSRLLLTGLALFVLLYWWKIPVVPLVAGLSTVVVTIFIRGAVQAFGHKVKEA